MKCEVPSCGIRFTAFQIDQDRCCGSTIDWMRTYIKAFVVKSDRLTYRRPREPMEIQELGRSRIPDQHKERSLLFGKHPPGFSESDVGGFPRRLMSGPPGYHCHSESGAFHRMEILTKLLGSECDVGRIIDDKRALLSFRDAVTRNLTKVELRVPSDFVEISFRCKQRNGLTTRGKDRRFDEVRLCLCLALDHMRFQICQN